MSKWCIMDKVLRIYLNKILCHTDGILHDVYGSVYNQYCGLGRRYHYLIGPFDAGPFYAGSFYVGPFYTGPYNPSEGI